ncbi:MAG: TetR family transcriptional regulator [Alphaproteobacteria bacterium]|nr:MAG: TetR family transcriptional regulator [Alphaproteobacteria bacterium]
MRKKSANEKALVDQKSGDKHYHHGDLRRALMAATRDMIRAGGVEALSLRKLAERVGVSRTAAYHYFKDKNVLLCTLAEEGFRLWQDTLGQIFNDESLPLQDRYRSYIRWYMDYAMDNAEYYDLMFGRAIWKQNSATDSLKTLAYEVFQKQVEMTRQCQEGGILPAGEDSLRLAQVSWGTLHGLARLLIDGIYTDESHIDEMCDCAANMLMTGHHQKKDQT